MYWFVLAPCADLQVVSIAKPYKTVIPLCTWSVTWQSCPPSVVPGRVEFYPGTTLSVSLLVHLSACPRGLLVWRRQCVLFLYKTQPSILFYFVSLEMAKDPAHAAWPECWTRQLHTIVSEWCGCAGRCLYVCVCMFVASGHTVRVSSNAEEDQRHRNKHLTHGSRQTPQQNKAFIVKAPEKSSL